MHPTATTPPPQKGKDFKSSTTCQKAHAREGQTIFSGKNTNLPNDRRVLNRYFRKAKN